jgi:hypothetical protein
MTPPACRLQSEWHLTSHRPYSNGVCIQQSAVPITLAACNVLAPHQCRTGACPASSGSRYSQAMKQAWQSMFTSQR